MEGQTKDPTETLSELINENSGPGVSRGSAAARKREAAKAADIPGGPAKHSMSTIKKVGSRTSGGRGRG